MGLPMKSVRLFAVSAVLLVLGVASFIARLNGSFSVTAMLPLSSSSVDLSVSAKGGWALGTLLVTAIGIIVFAVALISAIFDEIERLRKKDLAKSL